MLCCNIEFQCRSNARRIKHITGVETWLGSAERERGRNTLREKKPREAFWRSIWMCLQRGFLARFTSADTPAMLRSAEASQHRGDEDKSIGERVKVTSAHGNSRCGRKEKQRIYRLPQQWSHMVQNEDDYVLLVMSKKPQKSCIRKNVKLKLALPLAKPFGLNSHIPWKNVMHIGLQGGLQSCCVCSVWSALNSWDRNVRSKLADLVTNERPEWTRASNIYTFQTGLSCSKWDFCSGSEQECVSGMQVLLIFPASSNLLCFCLSMCRDALQCRTRRIKKGRERSLTVGCTFHCILLAAIPSEETFNGNKEKKLCDPKMNLLCIKRFMLESLIWVTFNATVILPFNNSCFSF